MKKQGLIFITAILLGMTPTAWADSFQEQTQKTFKDLIELQHVRRVSQQLEQNSILKPFKSSFTQINQGFNRLTQQVMDLPKMDLSKVNVGQTVQANLTGLQKEVSKVIKIDLPW